MFELLSLPEEDGRRILFHDDSNVIRRSFLEIWEEEVAGTFRFRGRFVKSDSEREAGFPCIYVYRRTTSLSCNSCKCSTTAYAYVIRENRIGSCTFCNSNIIEFFAEYRNQFVGRGEIVDFFAANTVVRKALNEGINCRKDTRLGGLF